MPSEVVRWVRLVTAAPSRQGHAMCLNAAHYTPAPPALGPFRSNPSSTLSHSHLSLSHTASPAAPRASILYSTRPGSTHLAAGFVAATLTPSELRVEFHNLEQGGADRPAYTAVIPRVRS